MYQTALQHGALSLLGLFFLIPLGWLLSTSLKPDTQIFAYPPVWVPRPVTLVHYAKSLTLLPFASYLRNTIIIALPSVLGAVLSSSMVAYSLSRIEWPGRDLLFFIIIATLMIPYQVTMIPLFLVMTALKWTNTFLPLIGPHFLLEAFFIFMLRQFFLTISAELTDDARIDGCNEWNIYWTIVLPLSKPALATVGLFTFMNSWNDFLGPLIYLSDETKYTLAIGLARLRGQYGTHWGEMMAVSVLMIAPIVVLYFLTQRTFIEGITFRGTRSWR